MTLTTEARAGGGTSSPPGMLARARSRAASRPAVTGLPAWLRTLAGGVLIPVLMAGILLSFTPAAHAEDDPNDYSLYNLASNAAVYFSEKSSPENDGKGVEDNWDQIIASPAEAGSLLGYADDENFVNWLFSTVSGSAQTVKYEAFDAAGAPGMRSYAEFGAAVDDLGLDTTVSSAGFDLMVQMVGGSLIWVVYILAMGVSMVFWIAVQILKLLNPFLWFHQGISSVSPAYANFASGITAGTDGVPAPLSGFSAFIAQWYGALVSLSWNVLVPVFIAFLLIGLVLFKRMNRGGAIRKLLVRVIFLAMGLPLLGGMYTSVLNQFDDSLLGQSSGPTKVVLSNYVDFDNWMNVNRLHIPSQASITWDPDTGHAQPASVFTVRNSALAINAQTAKYPGVSAADLTFDGANSAWTNSNANVEKSSSNAGAVFATIDLLGRYIAGDTVNASDFESNIQGSISKADIDPTRKKELFTGEAYKDADKFGEIDKPVDPNDHPLFSTKDGGLTATKTGDKSVFTSTDGNSMCKFQVVEPGTNGAPVACNMTATSGYNYLNTDFSSDSMTVYSSNKVSSGFTRSFHASVSQVGDGPAGFMYWANAFVMLGSIALLGFFYSLGLLRGALVRGFGMIAATIPATLGSLPGIAKVIIYSIAMVLEVLVTIFLYQFVSELIVSIPQIIEGPIATLVTNAGGTAAGTVNIFANPILGTVAVVVMTLISIGLLVMVTSALLAVRKSVLKAIDETVTKLVDRFLETNTPPRQSGGGLGAAMAGGLGSAAGMAASQRMMGNSSSSSSPNAAKGGRSGGPGQTGGEQRGTNAGGLNGQRQLPGGQPGELGAGKPGEIGGPDNGGRMITAGMGGGPGGRGRPDGASGPSGQDGGSGSEGGVLTLDGGQAGPGVSSNGRDGANGQQETTATKGQAGSRSESDRQLAASVGAQGGLTPLGVGGVAGSRAGAAQANGKGTSTNFGGTNGKPGATGTGAAGKPGQGGAEQVRRPGQPTAGTQGAPGRRTGVSPAGRNGQAGHSANGAHGSQGSTGQRGQEATRRPGQPTTAAKPNVAPKGVTPRAVPAAAPRRELPAAPARSTAPVAPAPRQAPAATSAPAQGAPRSAPATRSTAVTPRPQVRPASPPPPPTDSRRSRRGK